MSKADQNLGTYLGDGVYIRDDGHILVLFTHNGVHSTNSIYLEPNVAKLLSEYLGKKLR